MPGGTDKTRHFCILSDAATAGKRMLSSHFPELTRFILEYRLLSAG